MPVRKFLAKDKLYHVLTKSIAGYRIFNEPTDFERMLDILEYYNTTKPPCKFSKYLTLTAEEKLNLSVPQCNKIVKIIAYCIMPTHIHLLVSPLEDNILSRYMNIVLRSYTGYFNYKYKRKGPLWESRFKTVIVNSNEQLLHLTRYIHLNPTTAYLVERPEDWEFPSYNEYIGKPATRKLTDFLEYLDINPTSYTEFVNDRINYQRELAKIKDIILE
ncbi:MAG: transposase [Endomicrobia bacterium]|nr:transposase [Endomicrobiia bacterium]